MAARLDHRNRFIDGQVGREGLDIDGLLAGAAVCDVATRTRDLTTNPAALMALMWHHATGVTKPPLRLSEVRYGPDGELAYPTCRARAEEDVFPGYLRDARALFASRAAEVPDGPTGLTPGFEALRWFPLPPACLCSRDGGGEGAPAEMAASAISR